MEKTKVKFELKGYKKVLIYEGATLKSCKYYEKYEEDWQFFREDIFNKGRVKKNYYNSCGNVYREDNYRQSKKSHIRDGPQFLFSNNHEIVPLAKKDRITETSNYKNGKLVKRITFRKYLFYTVTQKEIFDRTKPNNYRVKVVIISRDNTLGKNFIVKEESHFNSKEMNRIIKENSVEEVVDGIVYKYNQE